MTPQSDAGPGERTVEVRWFGDGELPVALESPLRDPVPVEDEPGRTDLYLLGTGDELGVKVRGDAELDVKLRESVRVVHPPGCRLGAAVERWRKWSVSRGAPWPGDGGSSPWIGVTKHRRLWQLEPTRDDGPVLEVLVAEVDGRSGPWWSLGVETPAERGLDEPTTVTLVEAVVRSEVLELLVAAPAGTNVGYPAWLARRVRAEPSPV